MNVERPPHTKPTRSSKRAALQRRGRRMACWAAAVFVIGQLAAGAVLDYWAPEVRFPDLARVRQGMDALATPAEVVLLGSSRLLGVDAELINARLATRLGDGGIL